MFKRVTVFTYGVVSYLVFLASFFYAIGFIGNILVRKSIDSAPTVPFWAAELINTVCVRYGYSSSASPTRRCASRPPAPIG